MNIKDIKIVSGFEYGRLFKSPHGLLFLSFLMISYGWLAQKLYEIAEKLQEVGIVGANGDIDANNIMTELLAWWVGEDQVDATLALVQDHPPVLVGFFTIAVAFTGLFGMLAGIDQTASDISTRHLRFLLLRTDRASIYIGKSLAVIFFYATAMAIVVGVVIGVIIAAGGAVGFTTPDLLLYGARIYVTLVLYAIPFLMFMGFCSAMVGQTAVGAVVGFSFWLFVAVTSSLGAIAIKPLGHLQYAFPTAMKYQLMFDDMDRFAPAMGHALVLGLFFFAFGLFLFKRRDV